MLCIFPGMKKLFPVLLLIPVTVCGLLSGCGGGSVKSGDDGVYTYRFNSGENAGVLNIAPAANSSSACTMANVNIAFDDAGRNAGVITSGTITETGLDLDPAIDGVPRPMAGWTCRVHRD